MVNPSSPYRYAPEENTGTLGSRARNSYGEPLDSTPGDRSSDPASSSRKHGNAIRRGNPQDCASSVEVPVLSCDQRTLLLGQRRDQLVERRREFLDTLALERVGQILVVHTRASELAEQLRASSSPCSRHGSGWP